MRNVKGWSAAIVVLAAGCVEPEGLEPVEPRGDVVEPRSCPAFSAGVDSASLPDVEAALSGCTEVAGTLDLYVVEPGLELELTSVERVVELKLRWVEDAHISLPNLRGADAVSLEGPGSAPNLPRLQQVRDSLRLRPWQYLVFDLPALVGAGSLEIIGGDGGEISLPSLRAVGTLDLDCGGSGPSALWVPALTAAQGGLSLRECGGMRALDLPRFGEGAIVATNAFSLSVLRAPLFTFGGIELRGARSLHTVEAPSFLEGNVTIDGATVVSMALPAMILGRVHVAATRSVSLDLPHLESGGVSASALMESVVLDAPTFRDGEVEVSSPRCARSIRLPGLDQGWVRISTGECADDVLSLPRAIGLSELTVTSSVETAVPLSLTLDMPRLSHVDALRLSSIGGPEVELPTLTWAGSIELLNTGATRVSLPALGAVQALTVSHNPGLATFEAPALEAAGQLTFLENSSLPQCAVEAIHAGLTESCPLTTGGNDELAVCE